jgi:predicted Zn-dependent protease
MPAMGRKLIPALLVAGLTASAGAQQKACEIDEGTPSQVAKAVLSMQIAQSSQQAGKAADVQKNLKAAVASATDGDKTKNPVGRAFVLGKALVAWTQDPSMESGMTTRGALGFVDSPTAPYDLFVGIDSSFKVVEASNPDCESQTEAWRRQKPWVDLTNKSIELANSDKLDSAVVLAKRANLLSPTAPYGYMIIAQGAQKKNDSKTAIENFKLAIANSAKDTSMADTHRQLQLQLGNYASELAEAAQGAEKTTYANEAKAAYAALAKDPGTKYADAARQGTARVAQLSGDTTALKGSYADALANPSAFPYSALMSAAVTAARANQTKDAIKLFEAARTANPYHRDVLYNLSRLYLLDSSYAKGIPVARDLIKVDPSNPDNYQLLAIAYATMQKNYQAQQKTFDAKAKELGTRANTSKSAAVQKAAIDSAGRVNKFITAYNDSAKVAVDSAIKYQTAMTSLPGHVTFNEFSPTDAKTSIGGTVSNSTDSPKSFDMKIEFLDKSGNAVATQTVPVGPVAPGQSAPFHAEATGAGIIAFRYAPLVAK